MLLKQSVQPLRGFLVSRFFLVSVFDTSTVMLPFISIFLCLCLRWMCGVWMCGVDVWMCGV